MFNVDAACAAFVFVYVTKTISAATNATGERDCDSELLNLNHRQKIEFHYRNSVFMLIFANCRSPVIPIRATATVHYLTSCYSIVVKKTIIVRLF